MPDMPFWLAIVAAILIVVGRMTRKNRVAIVGFAVLAVAGLLVVLARA